MQHSSTIRNKNIEQTRFHPITFRMLLLHGLYIDCATNENLFAVCLSPLWQTSEKRARSNINIGFLPLDLYCIRHHLLRAYCHTNFAKLNLQFHGEAFFINFPTPASWYIHCMCATLRYSAHCLIASVGIVVLASFQLCVCGCVCDEFRECRNRVGATTHKIKQNWRSVTGRHTVEPKAQPDKTFQPNR